MGTRCDFYVGKGPQAEWLGSLGWDGYPNGNPEPILDIKDEAEFRAKVAKLIDEQDGTKPEDGWPWPWKNSNTTDYSYTFDEGGVWITCYGHGWNTVEDWRKIQEAEDEDGDGDMKQAKIPDDQWPNLSAGAKVTLDPQKSGLLIFGGGADPTPPPEA